MEYLTHKGEKIPLIGFGTYRMGENGTLSENEKETLNKGIKSYGMTLIDTAEMYANGNSETAISEIIGQYDRKSLFIVDKILPQNAEKGLYSKCCEASLKRLNVDYIDLYLLHWRGNVDLRDMVSEMEALKNDGLIRHWGVSNFDIHDMRELFAVKGGENCFCNQILYNLTARGAEFDLIPWCKENGVLIMAYSPLCHTRKSMEALMSDELVIRIAKSEGKTPESLALSFVVRNKDIITVFKTGETGHLKINMQNVFSPISADDLSALSAKYNQPTRATELETL